MSDAEYAVYVNVEGDYAVDEEALLAAAWQVLHLTQTAAPCAMTVTLASSERVRSLNAEFAGNDYETDVLSFPAEDDPYSVEPGEPPYLGDVVIAYPVAVEQAQAREHTVTRELQTLTIHGTLHLLGFDHETPEQQAEMWAYESAAMDALRSAGGG
jgi:probable rRNA maturation factor